MTVDDLPADRRPRQRWGFGEAALGYGVAYVLSGLAGSTWLAVQGHPRRTLGLTLAVLLGLWTGLVGTVVLLTRWRGTGSLGEDFGLRVAAVDVPLGIGLGVFSQVALVPLLYLPLRVVSPALHDEVGEAAREALSVADGAGFLLLAALIVVVVPLVEELFFRGLLQDVLVRRLGAVAGVALASLLFGLAHFQLLQLPGLVAFGAVLGVVTLRTGRLGAAVVAHGAFDAAAVLAFVLER